ncbi:competence/damage-inducible protein A [Verrucomicrobiaceae bacterium N1E253]|uniref:CinA-like protein n=1 Tax=Oceaniferula marina TaxID=2748318 RepID=A0A851GE52_9BACT|nr:competence/damage-inducible protein A [Oceaniferula marina]NWK55439.1 competence/damage-inducible protein A [Oceaniferula marina]
MKIEIINTGSELLLGATLNTHGAWIGDALFRLGLRVQRQNTVPDGEAITCALQEAMSRSDAVIVTGGIGPTSDDLSREALAKVLDLPLVEDPEALRAIQAYFTRLDRDMAEDNNKQAFKPEGCTCLPNHNGTAPGVYSPPELSPKQNCSVFLLPGPPGEMHPMFENELIPRLLEQADSLSESWSQPSIQTLRFTGIGESDFHARLNRAFSQIPHLEIGYCARPGELDLRLIGNRNSIEEAADLARSAFPKQCFSKSGQSLEERVVELLGKQGKQLSTAESCTGGRIANRITDVPGASSVFTHGFVSYSNEAKQALLGVEQGLLDQFGAVSEPVALAMAQGAREKSSADIAVAVTGIAGPDGGSADKPVGTVWLAVSTSKQNKAVHAYYPRGRENFKQLVSQKALDLVRLALEP